MKPNHNTDLGLGGIDAFGLDEMGQPVGLNPVWGAVVGTGLGTVGAIATRQFAPSMAKHSELVGFGLSALASGSMIMFEGTRAAGWTGLASAFLNNGLRQMELMFLAPSATAETAALKGFGRASYAREMVIDPTEALGMIEINRTEALGAGEMPTLVGSSLSAASQHVQLVGGPGLAQHSGHWGATVMG